MVCESGQYVIIKRLSKVLLKGIKKPRWVQIFCGKVFKKSNARLVRDGIVVTTTTLSSLKRFQDDVKEVSKGYDCGLQLKNYNDIKIGDTIEFFTELQVKKTIKN